MKVNVQKKEGSAVSLEVEAPVPVVEEALDKAYRNLVRRVTVPGFRKGKAPRHLLERHVGRDTFIDEAIREVLPGAYDSAVAEAKIEPVGEPEFSEIHLVKGEPLKFTATVFVRPEVDLGDYSSISVPFEMPTVSDSDVDGQFELLRNRMAQLEPLADDAALEDGHFVTCHVTALEGGDTKAEIDQDLTYIEVGKDYPLIPGLAEALKGMKKGEVKEFTGVYEAKVETTPEDNPEKPETATAPKTARFLLTVKETYARRLPGDEEVIRSMGKKDLEETKKDLRDRILSMRLDTARRLHAAEVEKLLVEKAKLDIPHVMVVEKSGEILRRFSDRLKEAGMDLDRYLMSTGKTPETLQKEIEDEALGEVRRDLILDALAEKEQVEAPKEAVDQVVAALAAEAGKEVGAVRTTLNLRGAMKTIEGDLKRVEASRKISMDAAERAGTPIPMPEVLKAEEPETPVAESPEEDPGMV